MAITFKWDLAADAEVTIARNRGDRMVRKGMASGLTAAATTSKKALMDAIRAAIAADGGIPTVYPDADAADSSLEYVTARAVPGNPTKAFVWAGYSPASFSGSPVDKFAVEDTTDLVGDVTQFFPGTLVPMLATIDRPTSSPDVPAVNSSLTINDPKTKVISASYPRNFRALVLNGLFTSRPSIDIYNTKNRVNDRFWQGLPMGYWRSGGASVRWGSSHGLYAVRVPLLSKGDGPDDDWSTYELLRHATGELVTVSTALTAALIGQTYAYGPRNNHSGIFKGGLYKTSNFGAVFDALIHDTPLSGGFSNLIT